MQKSRMSCCVIRRCSTICQSEYGRPAGAIPRLSGGTPATAVSKSACASRQSRYLESCARNASLIAPLPLERRRNADADEFRAIERRLDEPGGFELFDERPEKRQRRRLSLLHDDRLLDVEEASAQRAQAALRSGGRLFRSLLIESEGVH